MDNSTEKGQRIAFRLLGVLGVGTLLLVSLSLLLRSGPLQMPVAESSPVVVQTANESLLEGRRLVLNAEKLWRQGEDPAVQGDPEAASFQLEAALGLLKRGDAPEQEIVSTRHSLARALSEGGRWEKAHQAWLELAQVSDLQAEAAQSLSSLEAKLRTFADQRLEDSEGSLKAGQYQQAEVFASESLRLYSSYGGKAARKGMAHGALGYAHLHLERIEQARYHLTRAHNLYPQGAYEQALEVLNEASEPG